MIWNDVSEETIRYLMSKDENFKSVNFLSSFEPQDLYDISKYCNLSEGFIREFSCNFISWSGLIRNEKIVVSDKFCEEFDHRITFENYDQMFTMINGKYHSTIGPAIFRKYRKVTEYWYRGIKADVNNMKDYQRWLKLRLFS